MKPLYSTGLGMALLLCTSLTPTASLASQAHYARNIDVAFVLDTTGSMSGLIEGAKRKIWSIASDIADTQEGENTKIRFALLGYRDRGDAYVVESFDLTEDLNGIYGHLLDFRAQGGGDFPESVNQALSVAVEDMNWDQDTGTLRLVFLVGDAPPHMDYQDDTPYAITLREARSQHIIVNTVQAGNRPETTRVWREIAALGDGDYAAIPQSGGMVQVHTPYDEQIEIMQRQINSTVLGYGSRARQAEIIGKQNKAYAAPSAVASDMASYRYKRGKLNKVITGGHELVEDYEDGKVDLGSLKQAELPDSLKGLSKTEQKRKLDAMVAKRADLNARMKALVKKRDAYLKAEAAKAKPSAQKDAFDLKVRQTIRKQVATMSKK